MRNINRLVGAVSISALIAMSSTPAFAAGAQAGSSITNTVSVDYKVGTVSQTQITASNSFLVDRKINVTVAEVGTTTTSVSPGQVNAITTFEVTNLSNDVADFALTVAQQVGGAGAHSNTDNFDVSNVKIYVNKTANDFATATLVNYVDELAADAKAFVFVVADIPLTRVTGDVAAVTLTADAHVGGGAGSLGLEYSSANGNISTGTTANTAGVETVLADLIGVAGTNANYDGAFSAKDDYTVLAAALQVLKTSTLISDPINNTTNPKAIPGATVEYCIIVRNTGGATATDVQIADVVPAQVAYDATFGVKTNGTVTAAPGNVCTAGAGTGAYATGTKTVTGTLTDLNAGSSTNLVFRAILDSTTATAILTP